MIRVERSWDAEAGRHRAEEHARRGTVPIAAVLRDELDEHKLRSGRPKRISAHSARQTYSIRALRQDATVVALQKLLGHSSVAITERYLHVSSRSSARPSTASDHKDGLW